MAILAALKDGDLDRKSMNRMRPALKRRLLQAATAVGLTITVLVAAGLPVYVVPPGAVVNSAHIGVVLGPPTKERLAFARELLASGAVESLVVSVDEGKTGQTICTLEHSSCFVPVPSTTLGEVLEIRERMGEEDLGDVVVITKTSHVARTRFILWQCGVDATVVGVTHRMSPWDWAREYVYQTAGFVKAALKGCDAGEGSGEE